MAIHVWTQRPRLGEAGRPEPLAFFDHESSDAWSECDDPFQEAPEQPECWGLPPTEEETKRAADEKKQSADGAGAPPNVAGNDQPEAKGVAEKVGMLKCLEKHAGVSFVVAKGKRVTKHSKFEGFKSGWVSKLGTKGSAITEIRAACW